MHYFCIIFLKSSGEGAQSLTCNDETLELK